MDYFKITTENMFKINNKIAIKKRNVQIWGNSLVHFEKSELKRSSLYPETNESLDELVRIPKVNIVLGRFRYLAHKEKAEYVRCKINAEVLITLWAKLNTRSITHKSVTKVQNLVSNYQKRKKKVQ